MGYTGQYCIYEFQQFDKCDTVTPLEQHLALRKVSKIYPQLMQWSCLSLGDLLIHPHVFSKQVSKRGLGNTQSSRSKTVTILENEVHMLTMVSIVHFPIYVIKV